MKASTSNRFQQPTAVEACRVVFSGNSDFNVEMVTLLDQRRQIRPNCHQSRVRRTQNLIRISHTPFLHVFQQCRPVHRRGRIATGTVEARHQTDALQHNHVQPGNHHVFAQQGRLDVRTAADGKVSVRGNPAGERVSTTLESLRLRILTARAEAER